MKTQLLEDFAESGSAPEAAVAPVRPGAPDAAQAAQAAGLEQSPAPRRRGVADLLLQRATDAAQFDAAGSHQRAPAGSAGGAPSPPQPTPRAEPRPQARAQTGQRGQLQGASEPMMRASGASAIERAHRTVPTPADPPHHASSAPKDPAASAPPQRIPAETGPAPAPPLPNASADETFFGAAPEAGMAAADAPAAPDTAAVPGELPAWLSERLRADQERDARGERRRRWMRRSLAAAAAVALLALLAGGGWWVYQDNRVDGALTMVASTSAPARNEAPLARAGAGPRAGADLRSGADAQSGAGRIAGAGVPDAARTAQEAAPNPAPAEAQPAAADAGAGSDRSAAGAAPAPEHPAAAADAAPSVTGAAPEVIGPVERAVRRRPASQSSPSAPASRTRAGAEAASSHRREETLLQCRALGYDEQQCLRRGCAMTRFGLACRG